MNRTLETRFVVVRNGGDFAPIYALEGRSPTIRMDDSGEIKTSLSATFAAGSGINWLTDQIRAELVIDGVTSTLGYFLPASVREVENETTAYVEVEAYDRCWQVQTCRTEELLHLDAGEYYQNIIEQLLAAAGIGLISAVETDAVLAEDREDWQIGTSYLTIVNQLLGEINYKELWFDNSGAARLEPAAVPTAQMISHTYDASNVKSLLLPALSRETDLYSAPNVFLVICSNADKEGPMVATSVNDNPQSPLSTVARGRRIVQQVRVNNIEDETALQAYADRLRNDSMIRGETIQITTALLPGYGVDDVAGITWGDLTALAVEKAWSMTLAVGGEMQHTLERVVIALG